VLTALAETTEVSTWQPPIDVGATLAMEVGFATGGQVEQQVQPRDTLPLGLYRYPLYQHPFDRYGAGRVVGRREAVAVGARRVSLATASSSTIAE
jgi:hypothetical protein